MNLTPLGVYGAYPRRNGGTSAYLLHTPSRRVMLDFGSGALSRLQDYLRPEALDAIVLTHLHSDHMSDMLNLRYYLALNKGGRRLPVFLPESDTPEYRLIADCPHFDVRPIAEGEAVTVGDVTFRFYRMVHPVVTFGLRAECGGRVLGYSADTKACAALRRIAEGADLFLCDAAVLKKNDGESVPHIAVADAAKLAKELGVRMLLTHLMSDTGEAELAEALEEGADARIIRELHTYSI